MKTRMENGMNRTEKLKILKCEVNEGAQHVRVYTDRGWYSAFDDAKAMCLQSINKVLDCEIRETESKGKHYKNIIKAEMCDGVETSDNGTDLVKPSEAFATKKESNWGLREYEKCPVGLTIEVFISLKEDRDQMKRETNIDSDLKKVMNTSIELVKQARKEF